jgi:hypothetical protein
VKCNRFSQNDLIRRDVPRVEENNEDHHMVIDSIHFKSLDAVPKQIRTMTCTDINCLKTDIELTRDVANAISFDVGSVRADWY